MVPPTCAPSLDDAPQAMPDEFRRADPVEAYRAYYRATKVEGARWTNRNAPHWL